MKSVYFRNEEDKRKGVEYVMRNKDGIDDLDINDLYNNLKVFEADIKGSFGSSLNSQNVTFLSAEDTSSSNEVNTANSVSTTSGYNSQGQASSSSYTDDLMFYKLRLNMNALTVTEWGHFAREECRAQEIRTMLCCPDADGYDWSYIDQSEPTDCSHGYTSNLRRQTLSKDNLEIIAYQLGLESIEAVRLDDSVYRPTTNKTSASVSQVETSITPPSNTSVEMPRVDMF
ncbi:hypothetical protein Tco_0953483 [Tanacetum coccineum]|uniref:Uncharacterized protein n=1 Tax=Tanacetum coccineum TaxID=301880 RepID=A0ABQ5E0E8_9ASTR